MRDFKESLIDKLLLLYIIDKTIKLKGNILGKLKLQKLCFLGEWELMKQERKGLHFLFYRHKLGPFSKDVAFDYDFLVYKQHLFKTLFNLKSDGKILLSSFLKCTKNISGNKEVFDILNTVLSKWGKYCGRELANLVYEMQIKPYGMPTKKLKIRDIPMGVDILTPQQYRNFKKKFFIPDDLAEDFAYTLNLDNDSRKKMRASSGVTYEQRFT